MTSRQIAETVSHAIALEQTIADLQGQVDVLKERLLHQAEHQLAKDLGHSNFEGSSHTFKDEIGQLARVIFPKPKLITSFWEHDQKFYRKKADQIIEQPNFRKLTGPNFINLFSAFYKPRKTIRELAPVLLGEIKGTQLIEHCQEPSSPRVTFHTKES